MRRFRAKGVGRYGKRAPGQMTGTEQRYAELLFARKVSGEIVDWWFEAYTFKLGDMCRFTPDFAILYPDGSMEFVDAKGAGPIADDALVKIKVAAERFYMFTWTIEQEQPKKLGGGFKRREF